MSNPISDNKTKNEINTDLNDIEQVAVTKMLDPTAPPKALDKTSKSVSTKSSDTSQTNAMDTKSAEAKPIPQKIVKKIEPINTKKPVMPKTKDETLPPVLSTYMDFRTYLEDFLAFKRSQKLGIRKYSISDFAAAADLKSPQYLKLVIERQRNLSEDGVFKFCKALGLNKEDSQEFLYLVFYNQATQPKERYHYLQKLSEFRAKSVDGIKTPHWLKVILYSICEGMGGEYSIDDFKNLLGDKCKINELKECLDELVLDKAIVASESENNTLVYKKSLGQNTFSNDIPIDVIKKIQSDLLLLALESLFSDSPKDRDLGSFSIALTAKEFEDTKFEIRKFRKSLLKNLLMKREQSPGERVYQVQFQIFPVTK